MKLMDRLASCFLKGKAGKIVIIGVMLSVVQSAATDNGGEFSVRFPEISGMHKAGPPEYYTPENLYEYINGAAESYLVYEFRDLAVQIYENEQNQSVIVEVYHHLNPVHGFGIYSQERPLQSNFLDIGSQAYYEKGMLNFLKGNYYVKISAHDFGDQDSAILRQVARQMEDQLQGETRFPLPLSWFPVAGKIKNSERYISRNFLGYSFLSNVFTADYHDGPAAFTLFLLEADHSDECKRILESFLQVEQDINEHVMEGSYTIDDPYQGTIGVVWKGRYLAGVVNLESAELRLQYLGLLTEKIPE